MDSQVPKLVNVSREVCHFIVLRGGTHNTHGAYNRELIDQQHLYLRHPAELSDNIREVALHVQWLIPPSPRDKVPCTQASGSTWEGDPTHALDLGHCPYRNLRPGQGAIHSDGR